MREKVCIVLNEREPSKAQAADSLASALARNGITSSRIPVNENVVTTLKRRSPEICVLDYLLGDYTTGLDILGELQTLPTDRRPEVFMFTDEPSAKVAAESIKLGALDYFEIDNPAAVPHLTKSIMESFARVGGRSQANTLPLPTIDNLVGTSAAGQKFIQRLTTLAGLLPPIVIFVGAEGSGRTNAAYALASATGRAAHTTICNLKTYCDPFTSLVPEVDHNHLPNRCIIVQNGGHDDGELFEFVNKHQEQWWGRTCTRPVSLAFFICVKDRSEATRWLNLKDAEECLVPELSSRKEDIAALVHSILREAEFLTGKKVRQVSSESLLWLQGLSWPGNVQELRSVLTDTTLSGATTEEQFKDILSTRKELWEEWNTSAASTQISPLEAARTLEQSGHNIRCAAVRLGISPTALRAILEEAK